MKRAVILSGFVLVLVFILALSFISAAGVEIKITGGKTEFYQSSLLQAEILGTFPEGLSKSNIAIYQGDQVHSTPSESGLLKLQNKYLYYAIVPAKEGEYSIKIKDTKYWYGQEVKEDEVIKNITVKSTLDPYLSIKPGFISTTSDFSIKIKSLNGLQEITATLDATGEAVTKEIGYNAEKTFSFSIKNVKEYTESTIKAGSYVIPVFIYPIEQGEELFINETPQQQNQSGNETPLTPEKPQEVPLENATPQQIQTCEDINGKLCKTDEKCEGQTGFAKAIVCCLGECVLKPASSSKSWIGGIIILVLLLAGVYWFYKKSKKSEKTRKDSIDERTKRYQERMNPHIPPQQEIRKSLTKI